MTIEEKAKAYDELKVKASRIYNKENDVLIMHTLEDLFPELKESEDEKTRKRIIALVNAHGQGMYKDDMLAWLEKIEKQGEQKPQRMISAEAKEAMYDKPACAWSEEDEKILKAIHNSVDVECLSKNELDYVVMVDWFNALKDRVQPKQEWSEEDEKRIKDIIYFLDTAKKHYASTVELDTCIDWLKSLRGRYTWKPSDEQMEALFVLLPTVSYGRNPAFSLYNDLKKLRGE